MDSPELVSGPRCSSCVILELRDPVKALTHIASRTAAGARSPSEASRSKLVSETVLALFVALSSAAFAWVHRANSDEYEPGALETLMRGEGSTPFQYRILLPYLVGVLRAVGKVPLEPLTIALVLEALALVGLFYTQRFLLRRLVEEQRLVLPACFCLFAVLSFHYLTLPRWWYVYDIPSVLLFTLGVALVYRGRWGLLALCLAAGTLNREMICALIPLLLLTWYGRLRPLTLLGLSAGLSLIWVGVRVLQVVLFPDAPGGGQYDAHALVRNLSLVRDLESWPKLLACFGGLGWVVILGWRSIRPVFVRRALWIVPVQFALVFRFGAFDEIRVYGEMAPLVLLGAVCVIDGRISKRNALRLSALRPRAA